MPTASEYNHMSDSSKKNDDWMNTKWRPMMGWMYMAVCMFDFMIAPILWSTLQAVFHGGINTQWQPLTLQGAGLFHVAMGAVLGIAAYGRTQEKLNGVATGQSGGLSQGFAPGSGTTYIPPGQGQAMVYNTNQQPTNFGTNNSFNTQASSFSNNTAMGSPGAFNSTPPAFGAPGAFNSTPPAFGSSISSPTISAPPPAFGSKPAGPPAAAMPAL